MKNTVLLWKMCWNLPELLCSKHLQEGLQAVQLLDDNKKGKLISSYSTGSEKINGFTSARITIPALSVIEVDDEYWKLAEYF